MEEIDAVPELLVDELAGMIENADDSASVGQQLVAGGQKLLLGLLQLLRLLQPGAKLVRQLVEIQDATVVTRLVVELHMAAGGPIYLHAPGPHVAGRLRS